MYKIDEHDRVSKLKNAPQANLGAPLPIVLAGEHNVLLSFYLRKMQKKDNGTSVEILETDAKGDPITLVNFASCYAHMYGPPNDEAFEGHPLSNRGLTAYGVFEVKESSWLRVLEKMNSVHPHHDEKWFMENKKHFIFAFHDSTFECIAQEFFVEIANGSIKDMLPKMMQLIR